MTTTEEKNCANGIQNDQLQQRLAKIFALFAEEKDERIAAPQAHFIINHFFRLSRPNQSQHAINAVARSDRITFKEFHYICGLLFTERKLFDIVVERVYERFVSQVICKKRRRWNLYWCSVYPGKILLQLATKVNKSEKVEIILDRNTELHDHINVEQLKYFYPQYTYFLIYKSAKVADQADTLGNSMRMISNTVLHILMNYVEHIGYLRIYKALEDMQIAMDQRSKLDLSIYDKECSQKSENLSPSEKNLSWRIALECENARLLQLLDDERKALHDEEIVRTLATRMLDEERQQKEELERKLNELNEKLCTQDLNGLPVLKDSLRESRSTSEKSDEIQMIGFNDVFERRSY